MKKTKESIGNDDEILAKAVISFPNFLCFQRANDLIVVQLFIFWILSYCHE